MTLGNDNGTDGQTDGHTDRQTDGQTDRVRRNMRPPPREEGRIIRLPLYGRSGMSWRSVVSLKGKAGEVSYEARPGVQWRIDC